MMDHNYNDTPLLTNSDYESIIEDLKPDTFTDFGFRIDQNEPYEETMGTTTLRPVEPNTQGVAGQLPPPPPLQQYGPVPVAEQLQVHTTTPPEMSPSLSPTGTIPSRDIYPGHFEFDIHLDSRTCSKKSWLYSHLLNKVFIDMNKSLLIQFRVNKFMNGLFVRALPVFEQDDYVRIPVERCGVHAISDDPRGKAHPEPGVCFCPNYYNVRHVLLCTDPHARYDYNRESDRHSVVIPLQAPHPGSDTTTVEYNFTCKTSCPHGMNRKPIVVIFTLENEQREVLGRLVLPVKICSCPKRDKEKEEKEKEEREKEEHEAAKNGFIVPKPGKRRLSSTEKQELKRMKTDNTAQNTDANQELSADIIKKLDSLEKKMDNLEKKMVSLDENLHGMRGVMDEILKQLMQ